MRGEIVPERLLSVGAYPSPFLSSVNLAFAIPKSDLAQLVLTLSIYDALGRTVRMFVIDDVRPGFLELTWDGRTASGASVASGLYFYRVSYGGENLTGSIIRTR